MSPDEIRRAVVEALKRIAPEMNETQLRPDVPLRDQLDLDSMDFLNFVLALHARLGVDVPEADYSRLASVASAVDYLGNRIAVTP